MLATTCTNQATVTITPVNASPTSGPWQFDYQGRPYTVKSNFPAIDLPTDSGCWNITFSISGQNTLIYSQNPILINGSAPTGQFALTNSATRSLTISDQNTDSQPTDYQYVLNFTGMDIAHRTLDPVIKNGGKGTHPPLIGGNATALQTATFIISLAVFVTLLFVAYQLVLIRGELARK